jgi:glycosyltransferase involved in cell wall biosynthesis
VIVAQSVAHGARPHLRILGCRGIPAKHGGFETFAEDLSLYLTRHGWDVSVYCQVDGEGPPREEQWNGVRLVQLPVERGGALGTMIFDWMSISHALREPGLVLTLGYNTALFSARIRGRAPHVLAMDGLEWRRSKYNALERAWLWINEHVAFRAADRFVADHPVIAERLSRRVPERRIAMIPYGATVVRDAPLEHVSRLGLTPRGYALIVARPEPENSILELVRAFSAKRRGLRLVILGEYGDAGYPGRVREAASSEVLFAGPLYDRAAVASLRFHARLYFHGHTVGGTNPSLVEALAAASAVLAHDNPFNRWVAGDAARYFTDEHGAREALDALIDDEATLRDLRRRARACHASRFELGSVLADHEALLLELQPAMQRAEVRP